MKPFRRTGSGLQDQTAQSAGDNVSALIEEMITETEMVTANWE
jgi:hypothetical protein